jgi:prolipoprotein diacylglyceryltransferase
VTYFVGRFAVEFFKDPQGPVSLGLNTAQWLSLPFIVAGAWLGWRVFDQRLDSGWRMPEPLP